MRASRRSSRTSASRTRPSSVPSHCSSSRSASAHAASSTGRNVRRSDRRRRVATRAWCTPSGSSPMRTRWSWRDEPVDRSRHGVPDERVEPGVADRGRPGSGTSSAAVAGAPRACATLLGPAPDVAPDARQPADHPLATSGGDRPGRARPPPRGTFPAAPTSPRCGRCRRPPPARGRRRRRTVGAAVEGCGPSRPRRPARHESSRAPGRSRRRADGPGRRRTRARAARLRRRRSRPGS